MHDVAGPADVPAPLTDRLSVLTERGHAAPAVYVLAEQLAALDAESRSWCLDLPREAEHEIAATI